MKVLYITNHTWLHGANRSLLALMEDISKRYDVFPTLLVFCNDDKNRDFVRLQELCSAQNIDVFRIKFYTWQVSCESWKVKDIVKKIINALNFQLICSKYDFNQFDLIHTNTSVTHFGQLLADKINIPHVWHIREFGEEDYGLRYMYNSLYVNKVYERADKIIAISRCLEDKMKKYCSNIQTIYNGVALPDVISIKAPVDKELIKFCCVGVINYGKNQFEILEAVKILTKRGVTNFKVYFIGDGNIGYIEKLKQYVTEYGLQEYVIFLGYKEKIAEILNEMDIGVVPSLMEAFGRITVEYMLAQMPVIGADTGGTQELLRNTEFGFLYEHGRPESLAENMMKLINDFGEIRSLGRKAKSVAKEKYDVKRNTDEVYKCYEGLINSLC